MANYIHFDYGQLCYKLKNENNANGLLEIIALLIRVCNNEVVNVNQGTVRNDIKKELQSVDVKELNEMEEKMIDHLFRCIPAAVPLSEHPLRIYFEDAGDCTELRVISEEAWLNGHYGHVVGYVNKIKRFKSIT